MAGLNEKIFDFYRLFVGSPKYQYIGGHWVVLVRASTKL